MFEYSKSHELKFGELCLDTNGSAGSVKFHKCRNNKRNQQWDYNNLTMQFQNRGSTTCLAVSEQNNNILMTINCDESNNMTKWTLKDPLFDSNTF